MFEYSNSAYSETSEILGKNGFDRVVYKNENYKLQASYISNAVRTYC